MSPANPARAETDAKNARAAIIVTETADVTIGKAAEPPGRIVRTAKIATREKAARAETTVKTVMAAPAAGLPVKTVRIVKSVKAVRKEAVVKSVRAAKSAKAARAEAAADAANVSAAA